MFRVYDDATKERVLNELLKGERGINEIAGEAGITSYTAREWLKDHYAAKPDDPRRHLVVRESERYQREPEQQALELDPRAPEHVGADNAAREDMATTKKAKKARGMGGNQPNPNREKILAEYDAIEDKHGAKAELSRKWGVSAQSIGSWLRDRDAGFVRAKRSDELKAAVFEDLKAGYTGGTLLARHKKKVAKTTLYKWQAEFRAEQEQAPPASRRIEQPPVDTTLVSQTPASRSLALIPPDMPSDSRILGDSLAECIDERMTLRGMVALLNRENDQLKRDLRDYQRAYGVIRR